MVIVMNSRKNKVIMNAIWIMLILNCFVGMLSLIPSFSEREDSKDMDMNAKPLELNGANGMGSIIRGNDEIIDSGHTDFNVGGFPESVYLGDVDGDNDLDVVTANWDDDSVSVLLNNGDGEYRAKTDYTVGNRPRSMHLGDVDGLNGHDVVGNTP